MTAVTYMIDSIEVRTLAEAMVLSAKMGVPYKVKYTEMAENFPTREGKKKER